MRKSRSKGGVVADNGNNEEIEWELRPGGMLVQKRDDGDGASGTMIKLKVSHGSYQHEINVLAQATFGDLKRLLANVTGLEPNEQRLLFRGKEKEDEECLHMAGVKDMSKVVLLEDPASKEKKLEAIKMDERMLEACEAVVKVRSEVDKLAEKVFVLESAVRRGVKVPDKEFIVLAESLMVQLLKLDSIKADGEAKVQRRLEIMDKFVQDLCRNSFKVRRVQSLVDAVDNMKARNSNPSTNNDNAVSVKTKWETVEGGMGSLSAPAPIPSSSSSQSTQNWEQL